MASKQLGKLRQWAGEVILSRDKTQATDEFVEKDKEMELRRAGVERLTLATEDFHAALTRKKFCEAIPGVDKILAVDALGMVMTSHGEELGNESYYGRALVNLGRGHCRLAALQETFAVTLSGTFLDSLKNASVEFEEYVAQRKKLESRRLTYDSAISKADKVFKKDKDKKEAEEEYRKAKLRYEETSLDVSTRITSIQENDVVNLRDLTTFLDSEIKFIEQYLGVLKEVRKDWPTDLNADLARHSPKLLTHQFENKSRGSISIKDPSTPKAKSVRSMKSVKSEGSRTNPPSADEDSSDSNSDAKPKTRPRGKSEVTSRLSRPSSRQSRRRADSTNTVASREEKKRGSVAGWVGDAMSSVTGRRKGKPQGKDNFTTLSDDEGDMEAENGALWKRPVSALSNRSSKSNNQKGTADDTHPSTKDVRQKVVKALYDFAGAPDELSFKVGEEIVVVSEVSEGWWMGELNGKRGIFPSNYTEEVRRPVSKPPTPGRPKAQGGLNLGSFGLGSVAQRDAGRRKLLNTSLDSEVSADADDLVSDMDDHPFGDHLVPSRPSISDSMYSTGNPCDITDDEDPMLGGNGYNTSAAKGTGSISGSMIQDALNKRIPPPPPPRRRSTQTTAASRSLPVSRSQSTSTILQPSVRSTLTVGDSHSTGGSSPFDSQSDLSYDAVALTTSGGCQSCGCREFKTNPFKAQGMCANCMHVHA